MYLYMGKHVNIINIRKTHNLTIILCSTDTFVGKVEIYHLRVRHVPFPE